MQEEQTTAAVQRYLNELDGNKPVEPIVRELLGRSVHRLRLLCSHFLFRSYPRLTKPPLNLQADEMLSAVVERLLKAMHEARPHTVREFFGLASQHIRWELNDLARRLDTWIPTLSSPEAMIQDSSNSAVTVNAQRMLEAIDELPEVEREVFNLIRIQGLQYSEVARVLGVSQKTIQRRLNKGLLILADKLSDLRPDGSTEMVI
ncbi:MAG: sigma-70 family RNA polymerase sigma factor [Planctomycetia bacterium]|nr:sigma-70 family RNA polymerase sigma factor [Planctomycetia bacterium]